MNCAKNDGGNKNVSYNKRMQESHINKNHGFDDFRMRISAADSLKIKVDRKLSSEVRDAPIQLDPEDFQQYGEIENNQFVPYQLDEETFEDFLKRQAGIDRSVPQVIQATAEAFFKGQNLPASPEEIASLENLFTQDEIDSMQSYAILIGNEGWHGLALAFEKLGRIQPGTVDKIEHPLPPIREEADQQMREFEQEIREAADAVSGYPDFKELDTSPEMVAHLKKQEVMPQEPKFVYVLPLKKYVFGAVVQGDAPDSTNNSPIHSFTKTVDLIVVDEEKTKKLTQSLLDKKSLLRYFLGARIIKEQFKKMDALYYIFDKTRARKNMDIVAGEKWPFDSPARRPVADNQASFS